jgi:hypothetical protein
VHVYRSRSQDIAPMTKGGSSEGNRRKRPAAAHASDLDCFCRLPIPGQQFVDPIDRMPLDHALEHVMQVRVGFDVWQSQ